MKSISTKITTAGNGLLIAHDKTIDSLVELLKTDIQKGLSKNVIAKRQIQYGLNEIPVVKGSFWQVYLAPLFDTLITVYLIMTGILLVLAAILALSGDFSNVTQAAQWLVIVIINFAIAIVQQGRAQKKMDALQKLSVGKARVIREGIVEEIDVIELTPGDLIELSQGDAIPADSRLIESTNLLVNEASLTGESMPFSKAEDGSAPIDIDTPIGQRSNMLFKGTFIQTGKCKAIVSNIGPQTELGQISSELAELNTADIPLRKKINLLGIYLTLIMLIFLSLTVIFTIYELSESNQLGNLNLFSQKIINNIVTSMSIMPINIPLLTTIVLLTGVLAMANQRVIIRNLSAIESLGRISILSSDKTGTITRSQMTIKRVWDNKYLYGVTGHGYGPSGQIFPIETKASTNLNEEFVPDELHLATSGSPLELILISGMLNNNAEILVEDVVEATGQTSWKATGSATDAALLALFNKSGLNKVEIRQNYNQVREYTFDSGVKRMSAIYQDDKPGYIVFTKGATEVLVDRCSRIGYPDHEEKFSTERRKEVKNLVDEFATLGFRVITLCYKRIQELPEKKQEAREEVEQDLVYLGFVCVFDPPREGVKEAVSEAISAGITPIMITGDSPVTAATIAREVGMLQEGMEVHEGLEIESLSENSFFNTAVFARVSPQHKQIIIERYQSRGNVVAMTGDGVNDALALSMADAGICMGITGTDVAKQASDIVIADDSYVSIISGARQGRGLYQKIRLMIMFYIGVNIGEALIFFGTSFIPNFELLDTWQRIYIFGIVHAIPPLAIIFDQISRDIMDRDPIDTAGIFNKQLLFGMLSFSLVLTIMGYLVYFGTYNGTFIPVNEFNGAGFKPEYYMEGVNSFLKAKNIAHAKARTMLITLLYIAEPLFVLSIRRMDKSIFKSIREDRYWFVYLAVFSMPLLHVTLMYLPFIQDIFANLGITADIIYLDISDWIICLIAGILPVLSLELYKLYKRNKGVYF